MSIEKINITNDEVAANIEKPFSKFVKNNGYTILAWPNDALNGKEQNYPFLLESLKQHNNSTLKTPLLKNIEIDKNGSVIIHFDNGEAKILFQFQSIYFKEIYTSNDLYDAIYKREEDLVAKIIKQGEININVQDENGYTPLACAVLIGSLKMVETLLNNGADPDIANNDAIVPLSSSVWQNDIEKTSLLIKHNANLNYKYINGITVLHFAVGLGFTEMAKLLIDNGAEVNAVAGDEKSSAIHLAAIYDMVEIINLLAEKGANLNLLTIEAGSKEDSSICLDQEFYPKNIANKLGLSKMANLFDTNCQEIVDEFNTAQSALHFAAMFGHQDAMHSLLANNADLTILNGKNETVIAVACKFNQQEILNDALINPLGETC